MLQIPVRRGDFSFIMTGCPERKRSVDSFDQGIENNIIFNPDLQERE
jgi:hypothetical protein